MPTQTAQMAAEKHCFKGLSLSPKSMIAGFSAKFGIVKLEKLLLTSACRTKQWHKKPAFLKAVFRATVLDY